MDAPHEPSDARVAHLRNLIASGNQDATLAAVAAIVNDERAAAAAEASAEAAAAAATAATAGAHGGSAGAEPTTFMAPSFFSPKLKYPEPPRPEAFFGDPRRPPNVRSFLFQLDNYFAGWAELSEAKKIYFDYKFPSSFAKWTVFPLTTSS